MAGGRDGAREERGGQAGRNRRGGGRTAEEERSLFHFCLIPLSLSSPPSCRLSPSTLSCLTLLPLSSSSSPLLSLLGPPFHPLPSSVSLSPFPPNLSSSLPSCPLTSFSPRHPFSLLPLPCPLGSQGSSQLEESLSLVSEANGPAEQITDGVQRDDSPLGTLPDQTAPRPQPISRGLQGFGPLEALVTQSSCCLRWGHMCMCVCVFDKHGRNLQQVCCQR